MLTDMFIFYMIVGYFVNNIIALVALYEDGGDDAEIDFTNFILTIPIWPLTLYQVIAALLSKDE